ncbi:MAG: glycoside hydrolase family 2 protein [Clostridia bacterium]|nr:glycoside hydrolase family 2 protein [Clostridia bacterium]
MRRILPLNDGWFFRKESDEESEISLPHTFNAEDGQDGGNDYYRGRGYYRRMLRRDALPKGDEYFLELDGVNSVAEVYIDGKLLFTHKGGYSRFRVDITKEIKKEFELLIVADNSTRDEVYPTMADFTFYGGIYREARIIAVPSTHFDLAYYGTPGIAVAANTTRENARVDISVYVSSLGEDDSILYTLYDGRGEHILTRSTIETSISLDIPNPHLWHGRRDPYLYSVRAELMRDGEVLDSVFAEFGCRFFEVDPERGFILNGEDYPLRGVSRHQDRLGVGNALLPHHHEEDIDLIMELGANTVRLAHYQQSDYFYTLCDRRGLVVWAEIPYISKHIPEGRENTREQLSELILQNYNHASIFFWGLSNEITMSGSSEDLVANHVMLNELAHELDKTRLTAIACVSMCDTNDPYVRIPDVVAYNHYFGWYGGEVDMNGPWFDRFHAEHPTIPIGVSEYGAEALDWHTSKPTQGDYTEEYQAYYHEELIKQLYARPYLFATYVWNMFDFGADARAEGGENGQNHKGLVTFDRKYKKDAFFAYKAWLSDEPFVHIAGKRYIDRAEKSTRVTVYSNLDEVELFKNGESVGKCRAPDHFFRFEIANDGESRLVARAGSCSDEAIIRYVDEPNPDYILKEKGAVLNWFDIEEREGFLSLNSKISDITATKEGKAWFGTFTTRLMPRMTGKGGFQMNESLMEMMGSFTLLRLTGLLGMMDISFTKEELLEMNDELTRIRMKA